MLCELKWALNVDFWGMLKAIKPKNSSIYVGHPKYCSWMSKFFPLLHAKMRAYILKQFLTSTESIFVFTAHVTSQHGTWLLSWSRVFCKLRTLHVNCPQKKNRFPWIAAAAKGWSKLHTGRGFCTRLLEKQPGSIFYQLCGWIFHLVFTSGSV